LVTRYQNTKQPEKAIPLVERMLKRQAASLGRTHPHTLNRIAQLGWCYREVGRLADAIPLLREAYDALPTGDNLRRSWGGTLLDSYVRAGRAADAVTLGKALAAEAAGKSNGWSSGVANTLTNGGSKLLDQGAFAAAEALGREALAIREKVQPDNWQRYHTAGLVGAALAGQGKNDEAERLLIAAHDGILKRLPASDSIIRTRLREVVERLARLYESTSRPEKAREWTANLPREIAPRPRPVR
jgi:tetratricopeptide (TPR) repeat protein